MMRAFPRCLRGAGRWSAALLLAVAPACDSSPPSVPADHWNVRRIPTLSSLGDERVTAECATARVTIGPWRRLDPDVEGPGDVCSANYRLDVSVESDAGEAMLVDFLRPYELMDWRVHERGGRVRHDLSIHWQPYPDGRDPRLTRAWGWRPLTMSVCPEGERGPVLACWEESCELYDREEQVPEALPRSAALSIRSPWAYGDVQDVYEGETLEIPLTYIAYEGLDHRRQPDPMRISFHLLEPDGSGRSSEEVEISPTRLVLPRLRPGDSGTLVARLTAKANDIEQPPVVFQIYIGNNLSSPPCVVQDHHIQVRIHDQP